MNYTVEFDVAEVLEYDRTYNYIGPDQTDSNVSELFALKVRSCSKYFNQKPIIAKPSNINIKQIPMIGEFVLIYKTFNQESTSEKRREAWYYITSIDVQSSMNENMLPGISDGLDQETIDKIKPGKNFTRKSISPLQPYEGDLIVEGRWGNSIRFSSTIDLNGEQKHYNVAVPWKGNNTQGSPIIILSNGRVDLPNKQFVVEDINSDASSLYLTSTQSFPGLKLHNDLSSKADNASSFSKSQFIGIADRIILKSKTDIIALDSNSTIELNSPLLIIGNKKDSEKEWGLHSTEVIEMFNEFFYLITLGGLKDSTGMPIVADPTFADKFLDLREKLENKKIRQDKGN
jgi:hypothetical protein